MDQRRSASGVIPLDVKLVEAYQRILEEARTVAERTLGKLRVLSDHFPEALCGEDMRRLEQARAGQTDDRRRVLRTLGSPEVVEVIAAERPGQGAQTWIIDRSPQGLSVRLPWPADVGQVLEILPASPAGESVRIVIRYCRPALGGWVAGGEVLATTTAS